MTRIGILGSALLLCVAGNPASAIAAPQPESTQLPNIMIAEVSPEAVDSATKEYVLLYNPNATSVDVAGWMLQYRSASYKPVDTKGWTTKSILGCYSVKLAECEAPNEVVLPPGETRRLTTFEASAETSAMTSGMATTGGQVRLLQPAQDGAAEMVHDRVGYGTAADFEGGSPAIAPKAGRSIVRHQDDKGSYVDTDQNGADFVLWSDEDDHEEPTTGSGETNTPGMGQRTYLEAEITEVLPDPSSPQLDSADEFIEIYNPFDQPLDLTGYVLKTGASWTHKYAISEMVIEPYEYVALVSAQTHLSLSNAGTGVRLYDPSGRLVYEVPSYGKAQTGYGWVRSVNGEWGWTVKPTPGERNIVEVPVVAAKPPATSPAKKSSTKATTKKAATPKTSPAVKGAATTAPSSATTEVPSPGNQVGMWVLAAAVTLGAGYALFEYRRDIGSFIYRRWQGLRGLGRK